MKRAFSLLLTVALAAGPYSARAAEPAPVASPPATTAGDVGDAVTQHVVTIDGRPVAYTARAGTLALRDGNNVETARVFYTAYTAAGADRPVTFVYNGGPGSSTMWLRMGSIGPVRVAAANATAGGPAPYRVLDNPYSLLDKTDLVFIDMPDSGFGRIAPGKEKQFFGVDQDVAAFGGFISNYLSRFDRWNSPKFIFGESYGTTRSAALSEYLLGKGIFLNGVVLLSSILNFGLDYTNGDPIAAGDWAYVLYLPTEAATAWYHHRVANAPADLPTYLREVRSFALGEYLAALQKGDALGASQRDDVVNKLARYLGLPAQFVRNANIRVSYDRFQHQLLRASGQVVGRLDGRFATYDLDRASNEGPNWDPTDSAIDGAYTAAINQYLRQTLGYNPGIPYRTNIYDIIYANGSSWDFSHNRRYPTNTAPDLADAMTQNPNLKVFSANGYYDFATPFFATEYTLKHLNLNPHLQGNITYGFYESGHMVYLNDTSLAQFKSDLARWYDAALGH
jgi:carboxypeptidase C (cathepsin A)